MSFKNIKNIQLVRVPREIQDNVINKLEESLELYKLQTYNPILSEYITFFNNQYSPKLFTLNITLFISDKLVDFSVTTGLNILSYKFILFMI